MASREPTDLASKEATLQQRYLELLEKRVAQLESAVKDTADSKPKTPVPAEKPDDAEKDKDDKSEKDDISNKRYLNILRKWDKDKGAYDDKEVPPNFFIKKQAKDIAYTFRRVYNPETGDEGAYSELEIEDLTLISALSSEIGKYPGVNFESDKINMRSPFTALVHNWDKLNTRAAQDPECQVSKDLSSLLGRVATATELEDYFKIRDANLASNVVTFDTLWTIFAPGTLVVGRPFQNIEQVFKVNDSPIPWSNRYMYRHHRMWVWCWDWDGKKLVKIQYLYKFDRFRGTKAITELPYYPLSFHEDPEKLLNEARARALKFIKATVRCKPGAEQMFRYEGLAYADQRNLLSNKGDHGSLDDEGGEVSRRRSRLQEEKEEEEPRQPKLVQIKGEIIVDHDAFNQYGTGKPPLGELYTTEQIYLDELYANTEEYLDFAEVVKKLDKEATAVPKIDNFAIFPPRVLGYASREKIWGQFNLDLMSDRPKKLREKFTKNLQLDKKYKDLIEALVQSHETSNEKKEKQVEDIVQDKGKGLVLLLHGPPGVGKTLTAETIAQATAKPLVVVSVAEIGLDASRAERNLEKLFNLATKWEAILLVDEADVFLETRGATSSASRNALVSVLLRVLEYYRGIIILTTNRIKSIDIAVISRIHLAIRYEDLTETHMRSIFEYFLEQLEPEDIWNRGEINAFINDFGHHYNLNGRQIRNVVAAALAAARHQRPDGKMRVGDLKSVCEMTREFQEQLKENTRQQRYTNEVMR